MASRMSIERYLSAPMSDEAASAPAINAAMRKQVQRDWIDSPAPLYHSRETSVDVHSDGRPTFFTTASVPETVDTSYSANSRSRLHRTMEMNDASGPSDTRWLQTDHAETVLANRPATSGTIGPVHLAREWAERAERYLPSCSLENGRTDRAKTQEEIYKIQGKAKELELMMEQFMTERRIQSNSTPRMSNESARARMAANPKLAWILGDDPGDTTRIARPKVLLGITSDIPESPRSIGKGHNLLYDRQPRKSKSNGALSDETQAHHGHVTLKPNIAIERQQPNLPNFYCTFCQKRFHSRVEWLRHERTIHMPEELWVCCPRTGQFPKRCPFCEKGHPSPAHLADHSYLSCQEKPLSERTFSRKDHFLQHISQVHRVSPEQKPARLTELENAWRHPFPLQIGHQALHCGFCGKIFATYQERTTHVGHHFTDGADMMSWWKDRISHDTLPDDGKPPNSNLLHQCVYCERTFKSRAMAQELHPTCTMWSCSFLPGLQYTMYPNGSRHQREVLCCYCNDPLSKTAEGKVNGVLLKEHMGQHNFRTCNQTLYFSGQRFRQHLQDSHRSSHDSTLFAGWTLLLRSSQSEVPSMFQQIDKKSDNRHFTSDSDMIVSKHKDKKNRKQNNNEDKTHDEAVPMSFMELTESPQRPEPNKLRRKQSTVSIPKQSGGEPRPSLHLFARSPITDFTSESAIPSTPTRLKPEKCAVTPTASGALTCPSYFRKRFDASVRNRIYMGADDDLVSDSLHQLLRRIHGSVFGGLILNSSLVASVPALMTNCVDVYTLQEQSKAS